MIRHTVRRWLRQHWSGRTRLPAGARQRLRTVLIALVVCAAVISAAALGTRRSFSADKPDLTSGAIWLVSRAVGQVALVDGISAEVAATVRVGQERQKFVVAQRGHDAYVADPDGLLLRVDGATLSRTLGSIPPLGEQTVDMFPLPDALFLLDSRRQQVWSADPRDLTPRGQVPTPRRNATLAASDGRRLWVLDRLDGGLRRVTGSTDSASLRPKVGKIGGNDLHLALTSGGPAVVNPATHTAYLLSSQDGDVTRRLPLDAHADDLVSGSPDRRRILLVRPSEGTIRWCDFDAAACHEPLRVAAPSAKLGRAIPTGDHAFIPDHTAGVVHVVDQRTGAVFDTPRLLDHTTVFELVTRSGIVLFNDPDSEHAGVIGPDAAVRRVNKYDPRRPEQTDGEDDDRPKPPTQKPRPTPSITASGRPNPSAPPDPSASPDPGSTHVTPAPVPVPTQTVPDAGRPRILRIRHTPVAPVTGEEVRFEADLAGAAPETWAWSVTPLPSGPDRTVSRERHLRHSFDAAQTYRVTLAVDRAGHVDRRALDVSVASAPETVRCGEVVVSNVTLRSDLRCSGDGLLVGADDVTIDLNGHRIIGSGRGIGIRNDNYAGMTVRDGAVIDFEKGLALSETGGAGAPVERVALENMRLSTISVRRTRGLTMAGGSVDGVSGFVDSNNVSIVDVTFSGQIFLETTENWSIKASRLSGVEAGDNSTFGSVAECELTNANVRLSQTNDLKFTNNIVRSGTLTLHGASKDAIIKGNTFRNGDIAVELERDAVRTVVDGNVFEGNRIGVAGWPVEWTITRNTFTGNAAAGVLVRGWNPRAGTSTIGNNTFRSNGHSAGGMTDDSGRPINDGLHIDAPPDASIVVTRNRAFNNADYGIEAPPGSVRDGGGNTSSGDPNGCRGVTCG